MQNLRQWAVRLRRCGMADAQAVRKPTARQLIRIIVPYGDKC